MSPVSFGLSDLVYARILTGLTQALPGLRVPCRTRRGSFRAHGERPLKSWSCPFTPVKGLLRFGVPSLLKFRAKMRPKHISRSSKILTPGMGAIVTDLPRAGLFSQKLGPLSLSNQIASNGLFKSKPFQTLAYIRVRPLCTPWALSVPKLVPLGLSRSPCSWHGPSQS